MKRDGALGNHVCRNSYEILYRVSLIQHTRGFSNVILGNTKTLFVSVFLHHRFVYCLKFSLPDRIFSEKKRLKSRMWSEFSIKVMRDKKHKNVRCDNLSYTLTMMIIKQFIWKTSSCDLSEVMKWKFSVEWEEKSFSPRDVTILFESVFPQWKKGFLFIRKKLNQTSELQWLILWRISGFSSALTSWEFLSSVSPINYE